MAHIGQEFTFGDAGLFSDRPALLDFGVCELELPGLGEEESPDVEKGEVAIGVTDNDRFVDAIGGASEGLLCGGGDGFVGVHDIRGRVDGILKDLNRAFGIEFEGERLTEAFHQPGTGEDTDEAFSGLDEDANSLGMGIEEIEHATGGGGRQDGEVGSDQFTDGEGRGGWAGGGRRHAGWG